ncbi:uncharacterized protein LOC128681191 isoform X1 [Plodia interpunctella]|uniref:uncharacterized protein LOC128681191 isoform X1 n=1 Tax=Plodia interpunctella TaxID=58824 RepID=UPI002368CE3D|nr:uncharacterized protein LOC128681191 isoform X1 [Plodia interpunctella]
MLAKLKKIGVSRDRKVDESTSNSSLSNLRYVPVEKGKWNLFRKKEFAPIPAYPVKPLKGCLCGNDGPCKQKVSPGGVVIHYPQKKKKTLQTLTGNLYKTTNRSNKKIVSPASRGPVKVVRQKKFLAWRVDKVNHSSPLFKVRRAPFSQL